ncbi:MAG: diaminopimelate epimerase [Desulfobacterales bacterium]|nr:diaminopimelate epimerase [Desulfobacterales bacterium]
MKFYKYHGLGNDYIVLDPCEIGHNLNSSKIITICHRNLGIGSDGILYGPFNIENNSFSLRIFNPDGSEAEKSGNGLRIFSRYLWDKGVVSDLPFSILTLGGETKAQVFDNGAIVSVELGNLSFYSKDIPMIGENREVINEVMEINGEKLRYCAANIGNPHCVIFDREISEKEAKILGPLIEKSHLFPNKINVQFIKILDKNNIQIEIWERGAGYTLSSGTSSAASAGIAFKLGLCSSNITVHMQGGTIEVSIKDGFHVSIKGSVTKIAEGFICKEIFI